MRQDNHKYSKQNSFLGTTESPLELEITTEKEFWGSGDGFKPAKRKILRKVHHLTADAIAKQIYDTREIQKLLSESLDNLESCSTLTEIRTQSLNIFNLYKKAEHLADVIDILDKLNKEIKFCRKNLPTIHDEKSKAALSHRIEWLERGINNIIERNNPEKLDRILQLKSIPVIKKQSVKRLTGNRATLSGSPLTLSSPAFNTELPLRTPPKSILHQSTDFLLPLPPLSERSFYQKKAVTLPPVSVIPEHEETESQVDASDEYWKTGHHRFIYSPNKDTLLQENALSYHFLGLAVPANFVPPTPPEYISSASLPWLTEQDASKGNFDILRGDLERVLRRTRRMQDKVWKAANLSVESHEEENIDVEEKENKMHEMMRRLQSRGSTRERNKFSTRGSTVASLRSEKTRVVSSIKSSRAESSASTVCSSSTYLSDIPDDDTQINFKDIIPLTRTNMSKQYPHTCDRWTDALPDPDHVMSQKTIVNQRNLYNKTKLKLFVQKRDRVRSSIKRDLITPNSVTSNRSFRRIGSGIRFIEKLKSNGGNSLSQLQKERLDDLIDTGTTSVRVDDRVYAARSLSFLGIADTDRVQLVLIDVVVKDLSPAVRYEAAKALLNLGFWPNEAVRELTLHLRHGNTETQLDVLEQIACTSNVRRIFYTTDDTKILRKLVKELKRLVKVNSEGNDVSFQAAVCLGELCGDSDKELADLAQDKLRNVVATSTDWSVRAQCLEVLVRRLDFCDEDVFHVIVRHLRNAIKWKDRLAAALLIAFIGANKLQEIIEEEEMYEILHNKVWDDVKREVRLGVSQAITALGIRSRLLENIDESLRDTNEEIRSQAVIAMSAAGIRSDTTLRFLVEMLGLDPSDYVRLQVIRTFQALGVTDIRVVRAVRERERSGGPLAKAARRYFNMLDIPFASSQASCRQIDNSAADERIMTRGNSSWSYNTRGSNLFTRNSTRIKGSPTKSSRRTSFANIDTSTTSKIEIISTAVRKSPLSKISPATASRISFTNSRIVTSASSFF